MELQINGTSVTVDGVEVTGWRRYFWIAFAGIPGVGCVVVSIIIPALAVIGFLAFLAICK